MKTLNILIPTDFTEVSYPAIDMARVLERKLPGQLIWSMSYITSESYPWEQGRILGLQQDSLTGV